MEYQEVCFFITTTYGNSKGWPSQKEKEAFRVEIVELFTLKGWELLRKKYSKASDTVRKGMQELHLHPNHISGVLLPTEIETVQALLMTGISFQLTSMTEVKIYTDMDDIAYRNHLQSRREEMVTMILEKYTTEKRTVFINVSLAENVGVHFIVPRLADRHKPGNMAYTYVAELIDELVVTGQLLQGQTQYGTGLRTATKRELAKAKKLSAEKVFEENT